MLFIYIYIYLHTQYLSLYHSKCLWLNFIWGDLLTTFPPSLMTRKMIKQFAYCLLLIALLIGIQAQPRHVPWSYTQFLLGQL